MKSLNDLIYPYKALLENEDIQKAYKGLLKYLMSVKSHMQKNYSDRFSFGNISPGYLDFSYFPFSDKYLQDRKLRFGIVLNHKDLRFELWLMGRDAIVKDTYWDILKATKWNERIESIPQYAVMEIILVEKPDFKEPKILTRLIERNVIQATNEVIEYFKDNNL